MFVAKRQMSETGSCVVALGTLHPSAGIDSGDQKDCCCDTFHSSCITSRAAISPSFLSLFSPTFHSPPRLSLHPHLPFSLGLTNHHSFHEDSVVSLQQTLSIRNPNYVQERVCFRGTRVIIRPPWIFGRRQEDSTMSCNIDKSSRVWL